MAKLLRSRPAAPALGIPTRETAKPSYDHLNSRQLRAELDGRTQSIQASVEALKQDLTAATGLKIGGNTVPMSIQENAFRNAGIAIAGGLLLGALVGLRARSKRRPEPEDAVDIAKVRLATLLDEAAGRVAKGTSAEDALRATLKKAPIVYNPPTSAGVVERQSKSSLRQAVDVAVKSAVGFALKVVVDELQEAITGKKAAAKTA